MLLKQLATHTQCLSHTCLALHPSLPSPPPPPLPPRPLSPQTHQLSVSPFQRGAKEFSDAKLSPLITPQLCRLCSVPALLRMTTNMMVGPAETPGPLPVRLREAGAVRRWLSVLPVECGGTGKKTGLFNGWEKHQRNRNVLFSSQQHNNIIVYLIQ